MFPYPVAHRVILDMDEIVTFPGFPELVVPIKFHLIIRVLTIRRQLGCITVKVGCQRKRIVVNRKM